MAAVAVLGGLDALVFTGGIGEHSSEVCPRLPPPSPELGLELEASASESPADGADVAARNSCSRVPLSAVAAREALTILAEVAA